FREGEIIYLNGESDASEKVCLVLLSKVPLDMEIPKESVLCADPWVPWAPGFKPQPKCPQEPREQLVVAQLLNPITKSWNYPSISELFDEGTV
ncbi:hypothetical protein FCV25MIE_18617, partial [Fagus crenata]